MSVGINPTTVDVAGPWMASALGLSWDTDRSQVLEGLNDYRNLLYNLYSDFKLFDDVFHCMCIQDLPYKCKSMCGSKDTFKGITLPQDVSSITAAWESNYPLKLRSRWRESHTGIGMESTAMISLVEAPERSVTERPLECVTSLQVFCDSEEDEGKRVIIEVLDAQGLRKSLSFSLEHSSWAKSPVKAGQILSVQLPADMRGLVTLAEANGRELSIYKPGEVVPLYRRFRVKVPCSAKFLLIQGVKRFEQICFDHDIVEVGDKLVIKAAGSYLRMRENTVDPAQINRAEYDLNDMKTQLEGLIARGLGNSTQDNTPLRSREISRTGLLPGYFY